jgi:hypothetical protein
VDLMNLGVCIIIIHSSLDYVCCVSIFIAQIEVANVSQGELRELPFGLLLMPYALLKNIMMDG